MALIPSLVVLAACTFLVRYVWERLTESEQAGRWFWRWYGKGVLVPLLLWLVLGLGIIPGLPGVIPRFLPGQGPSLEALFAVGTMLVGTYWAGLTLLWLALTVTQQIPAENVPQLRGLWLIWSVPLLPLALLLGWGMGWGGAGFALGLWLFPIAHGLAPLQTVVRKAPQYSSAMARLKFGKFDEAEWEILRQLEGCEEDFQGWFMLAELYACHFGDLPGAARIVRDLIDQPNVTPSDQAVALHKLADWHLQFAEDPDAARLALAEISARFPDTLLDRMARQRAGQLPASTEELRERRKPRRIALPGQRRDTARESAPTSVDPPAEPAATAQACVRALEKNPDDVDARERLARLFAGRLGRKDSGIEQLELLLTMAGQSADKRTEWLLLLAQWQLLDPADPDAARGTLRRVLADFPQTGAAFEAQRRLCLLDVEQRFRQRHIAREPGSNPG